MLLSLLIAGFTIGIVGSFHCVGMCGPIALALPVGNASKWQRFVYITLYNLGRIFSYAILGIFFGFLGKQFFIGGFQQALSITLGIIILLALIFAKYINGNPTFLNKYNTQIKKLLSTLFKAEKHFYTFFLIGFFNGFLPCGLVYVAVAGAVATGNPLNSALFMAAFGFGTFPIMFAVTVLGKFVSLQWRTNMRKAVPYFVGAMAVLLILRGLNLGIPYISPEMKATPSGTQSCCHKE